ncbi:MAG: tetratricopeptide repeat protein, partial [Planctomycetaceae bacterium]
GLSRSSQSAPSVEPSLAASAASLTGESMDALLSRADSEVQRGDLEEAKSTYRQVLALKADHPVAHHRLAIIADRQNDFEAANFHYEFARRSKGADPDLLNDMGYSCFLQGDYKESERLLRQALEVRPTHRDALSNLGRLYSVQGKYSAAASILRLANSEPEAEAALAQQFRQGGPAHNAPRIGSNLLAEPLGPLYAPELRPTDRPGPLAGGDLADTTPRASVLQEADYSATLPRARFTDIYPTEETEHSTPAQTLGAPEPQYADWNRISTSYNPELDVDRAHDVSAIAPDPQAHAGYPRAPGNVDPLDSMPVWPPSSSGLEIQPPAQSTPTTVAPAGYAAPVGASGYGQPQYPTNVGRPSTSQGGVPATTTSQQPSGTFRDAW